MSIESQIRRCLNLDKILRIFANLRAQKYVYLSKCNFRIVHYNSGSGTQISGSSSSSRHLKFLATDLTPTSKNFWLRLQNDLVNSKLKNIVIFVQLSLYTSLDEVSRNDAFDG